MDLTALSTMLQNLIRVGTIIEVDHAQNRCRVASGKIETDWLPWFVARAGTTSDWDPPTIGEQCIILSPSGELAGGFVLPGIHSDAHPAPSNNANETVRIFPDGATISYNHQTGALNAVGIQSAMVQAANTIVFDCPQVTVTGELLVQNVLTYQNGMVGIGGANTAAAITGDVIANGKSLVHHKHPGDSGGITGAPI